MLLKEIVEKIDGTIVVDNLQAEVKRAYTSDLLSDVMAHCKDESVLITIQNHLNTIAVCTLVGIEVVVICNGRSVPDDMAAAAKREGVAIVTTQLNQFVASVKLSELAVEG